MADSVSAVVALLKDENIAEGRVFGARLPDSETSSMPRDCVIVRPAGGGATKGYMPTTAERVDIRVYSNSEYNAHQLSVQIARILHNLTTTSTSSGKILWAKRSGGPFQSTESDTKWPFGWSSWQVQGNWLAEEGS